MIRFASLLAAASLAGLATPALAQDEAPALPPIDEAAEASPADAGADYAADSPAAATEPAPEAPGAVDAAAAGASEEAPGAAQSPRSRRLAYSGEERAAWLDQCRKVYGSGDTCETYHARYELAATDPKAYARQQGCAAAAIADEPAP